LAPSGGSGWRSGWSRWRPHGWLVRQLGLAAVCLRCARVGVKRTRPAPAAPPQRLPRCAVTGQVAVAQVAVAGQVGVSPSRTGPSLEPIPYPDVRGPSQAMGADLGPVKIRQTAASPRWGRSVGDGGGALAKITREYPSGAERWPRVRWPRPTCPKRWRSVERWPRAWSAGQESRGKRASGQEGGVPG
jgi:hypothetical protein